MKKNYFIHNKNYILYLVINYREGNVVGNNISFLSVFLSGILSFLSPCVLPLIPPYLCYMSGVSIQNLKEGYTGNKTLYLRLILGSLSFILGFTTIFVILGATASELGILLNKYRHLLMILSGIVIILMGLNFLGIFRISFFSRELRFQSKTTGRNFLESYLMGMAFAFGWTPCIGPILGAVLSIASQKQNLLDGAFLLMLYSIGLGIPFFLAAIFSRWFMIFLNKFKVHLGYVEKIIGILLILSGILFLTGQIEIISMYIINLFPFLSNF